MLRYVTKIKVTDIFVPCYAGEHYSGIDYADIKQMETNSFPSFQASTNSFPSFQASMCMTVVLKTLVGKISSTHVVIVIFNTVGLHNIQKST